MNERGFQTRYVYEALRRPTRLYVRQGTTEILAECAVYGELLATPEAQNLRGKMYQHYDEAGVVTNVSFDFKGNPTAVSRQLAIQYQQPVDWSPLSALIDPGQVVATAASLLQQETFTSSRTFDAASRLVTATAPDGSVTRPVFNEANLLEQISVNLSNATSSTPFVTNIDYNAKGQRTLIQYGNGAQSAYSYDPETFRFTALKTTRAADGKVLQRLRYSYDPIGNIASIEDGAQQTVYFSNQVVTANADYTCDAIYRLIGATGREHIGQLSQPQTNWDDISRMNQPLPTDGQAMRNYIENYSYDAVGNILQIAHQAVNGNWTRTYAYDEPNASPANSRLTSTTVGAVKEPYAYDPHGNITQMPHLPQMAWDFRDQLASTRRQVVNNAPGETTYYLYDVSGERVRKVTQSGAGTKIKERIYLGGYEVYREYGGSGGSVTLERQTLHLMDDKRRVALVETNTTSGAAPLVRYQFDNQLGSALLELDTNAAIISYEEYYPYGSTSFLAVQSAVEVSPKRYRYTGKERDDETELYYHGARYYAPWLGRWTACDPLSSEGSIVGAYVYVRGNPIIYHDPQGTQEKPGALSRAWTRVENWFSAPINQDLEVRKQEMQETMAKEEARVKASGSFWDKVLLHFAKKEVGEITSIPNTPRDFVVAGVVAAGHVAQDVAVANAGRGAGTEGPGAEEPAPSAKPSPTAPKPLAAAPKAGELDLGGSVQEAPPAAPPKTTRAAPPPGDLDLMGAVEEAPLVEGPAAGPAAGPANLMKGDDPFLKNASNRSDVDPNGNFDVVAHGTPRKIEIQTANGPLLVDQRVAARLIQNTPGYNGGPIRLLSCNTGACDTGFAQNLANKMGVPVLAPTNFLWAYSDGSMVVAPRLSSDPSSRLYNMPDNSKRGSFRTFTPGKKP